MVQYSKIPSKCMISKGFYVLNLALLVKMGSNIQILSTCDQASRQDANDDPSTRLRTRAQWRGGRAEARNAMPAWLNINTTTESK